MRFSLLLAFALAAAACGGGAPKSTTTGPGGAGGDGPAGHPPLTPEMDHFHDLLAPLWHHDGPDRLARACASAAELVARARAIQDAEVPERADRGWRLAVSALVVEAEALSNQCGDDDAEAAAAFEGIHQAFHDAMESLGVGHGHGDGHGHGHEH